MRKRGRPRGTGYDDLAAIARVFGLMRTDGMSRRSAIIRVCGVDQLRRIEMKMAHLSNEPNGPWRRPMREDDRTVPFPSADVPDPYEHRLAALRVAAPGTVVGGFMFFQTPMQADAWRKFFGELSDEECERHGILRMSFLRPDTPLGPMRSNTLNPFIGPDFPLSAEIMGVLCSID